MRITFERTGGFAGMKMTKVIDTAILPTEEKNQLHCLLDAADFFHLPATLTAKSSQPDRFQYRITVEENARHHTVVLGERELLGTLRPLVEWLIAAVRRG